MRRVSLRGLAARKLRLTLTALAIVLGVTFVTGTLVLGDTLNRTFDNLVGTVYQHVSFEIRGKARLHGGNLGGVDSTANRATVPESILPAVRKLPGVQFAYGSITGYAQFIDRQGNSINDGNSAGFSFDPNPQLSALRLVKGHAPVGSGDVLMDVSTATKHHFKVGDRVRMLVPGGPRTFMLTGLIKFGNDNSLAGASLAAFSLPVAQDLFNSRGRFDTINILAAQGADNVTLQRAISRVLPPGVEVVSGQTVANELHQTINNALSFLTTALLIFGFIALFVGAFTIFNTFSITIGQRTRELALLRLVGAGRGQVFGSVLAEAALTGLVASIVGLGLGVLAALGLKALLGAFGISLPSAPLVFRARTPIVALAVGIGVTVLSAVVPAWRAVRIAPVAALVEQHEDQSPKLRRSRLIAGVVIGLAGVALLLLGVGRAKIGLVGLGALGVFIATVLLVPLIARPLSGALGRPIAAALGIPGRIGRENSMRNPRRTAQTAGALMIGIALVSTIAVLGASLSTSAKHNLDSAIRADYIIGGSNSVSNSVPARISRLPGVDATTLVYKGQFDIRGSLQGIAALSPDGLQRTVNLHLVTGRGAAALAAGELLVDSNTASSQHLHVGSVVPVTFAQTGSTTMRVGGIYAYNPLAGSYITSADFFVHHFNHPLLNAVLVSTTADVSHFERTLNRELHAYPNLNIQSREQFLASEQHSVNQLLGLIYVLLALAVVVALIGIVNTLMLSVFERTHEIGLLRAVGMKRRQVKRMIRSESVIISLFGAVIGIVVGTGLGLAMASSLRNSSVTDIGVPISSLVVFLVLSALLGVAAAIWPARRAANLDVLSAIATE
ncbi:MAG TPA: ABC transporter permease [Solirubrobacteraceae bacterium]